MADWVKLTRASRDPKPVWVNLNEACYIDPTSSGSLIRLYENNSIGVVETPDQILAAVTDRGASR